MNAESSNFDCNAITSEFVSKVMVSRGVAKSDTIIRECNNGKSDTIIRECNTGKKSNTYVKGKL